MDLAAVAKLVTDKPDKALATMLSVWRKRRLPRLADAIDGVDRLVEKPWGPLFGDKRELHHRTRRVSLLGKQPHDPRFAHALLEYLREMPFTSNGSRGMWASVFMALDKLDDPRVIASIREIRKTWKIRPLQREWLDEQADRLLATYATRHPDGPPIPSTAEAKHLTAIERAIATGVPAGGDARRDALLAEVYADPTDDAPRSVLADHLDANDDPRGEFITLQLLVDPTSAQTKRMTTLLAKHERTWLGSLERAVAKDGVVFRRGFLAACRVKLKNAMEADRYIRDPSWATVENLRFTGTHFSYQPFSAQDSGVFAVDPVMKSLRDVNLHDDDDLARLLEHKWPHLERLATSTEQSLGKSGLAALKSTDKLPVLNALEMFAPPKNWFASAKFAKRLRDVVLGLSSSNDANGVVGWLPELARLPALHSVAIHASRSLGTYPRWTFTRDGENKLSIATLATTPRGYDTAVATLAALPDTQLTSLSLKVVAERNVKVTPAQRAAMTAAARRQRKIEIANLP